MHAKVERNIVGKRLTNGEKKHQLNKSLNGNFLEIAESISQVANLNHRGLIETWSATNESIERQNNAQGLVSVLEAAGAFHLNSYLIDKIRHKNRD